MSPSADPTARSLADELRAWPADRLAALLRDRPDLAVPIPEDLTALATRVSSRASVQRALDGLDTPALQVVEVLAALPEPTAPGAVTRRWGSPAAPQLARLRDLALVWGPPRGIRLVRTVRDVLGPHPAGLGPPLAEALDRRSPQRLAQLLTDLGLPPAADPETALTGLSAHLGDPGTVRSLLDTAPDGVLALLDRLTWGPPVGRVADADRPIGPDTMHRPVDWLLAHGLLAVADNAHLVLPREVGLVLRDGRVHRSPEPSPPSLSGPTRSTARVVGAATGTAAEAVRLVDALGALLGATPVPVLRSGGLGVRDLRRIATALDVPESAAARLTEIARAAGLIGTDQETDPHWAPTPAFDMWRTGTPGQRWADLTEAWLATSRVPGLVGTRDEKDTPRQALGPGLDRAEAPELRRRILRVLADAPAPDGQCAAPGPEPVRAHVDWARPRRAGRARDALIGWTLDEASWLGVTGAGALAPFARPLLADPPDGAAAAEALDAALPDPVDHILLQADLTAVVPGPPDPDLARELDLAADVDSRGGATVYRFSDASIRRAMDAGRTGEDLLDLLTRRSRTPLPQALHYLVTDVARRHGRLRVGAASCYLRTDDEAALAAVLADRRTDPLGLRRLAPTVLAARAAPDQVVEVLRRLGLAPAVEGPDGSPVLDRPRAHRAPPGRPPHPVSPLPPAPSTAVLDAAVDALIRADRAILGGRSGPVSAGRHGTGPAGDAGATDRSGATGGDGTGPAGRLPVTDPVEVLAVLRDAATRREAVWIGYADGVGRSTPRLVQPLHVEGGRVDAFDRAAGRLRSFAVHRVTGVTPSGA